MQILMIGDVVGRVGRKTVAEILPAFKKENDIDWVIANGENLAGGIGLDRKTVEEMFKSGVDIITSGNHVFRKEEAEEILKKKNSPVLRPANYPPSNPGRGWGLFENALGQRIIVINIIGRVFFREDFDCPFRVVDNILENEIKNEGINIESIDAIVVDFHAEATSEKIAMGNFLDGRVTAVAGTHTHVATADETILPEGTAYISDLGMTGAVEGVLGVNKNAVIKQFLTQLPLKFVWKTSGPGKFCGAIIKTKKGSNKAISIRRISHLFDN